MHCRGRHARSVSASPPLFFFHHFPDHSRSSIPFNPLFHFSISLCYSLVSILLILCCMAVKEDGSCYSKSSYFVLSPSKVKRVQRGNLILSVFLSAFPPHRLSHWPHSYNIQVCVKVSSPKDTLYLPVFPSVCCQECREVEIISGSVGCFEEVLSNLH